MDGQRFDSITRALASGVTRRAALRVIAGGVGAAVAGFLPRAAVGAARLRRSGDICRKNGDCNSDFCGPKDATGRQRCDICPNDGTPCGNGLCCPVGAGCINGSCCANPCGKGPNAVCCESGQSCIAVAVDLQPTVYACCAEELTCDDNQVCCAEGETCVDSGNCCPNENVCDIDSCCTDGAVCINDDCCPESRQCTIEGDLICCNPGEFCINDVCVGD